MLTTDPLLVICVHFHRQATSLEERTLGFGEGFRRRPVSISIVQVSLRCQYTGRYTTIVDELEL